MALARLLHIPFFAWRTASKLNCAKSKSPLIIPAKGAGFHFLRVCGYGLSYMVPLRFTFYYRLLQAYHRKCRAALPHHHRLRSMFFYRLRRALFRLVGLRPVC